MDRIVKAISEVEPVRLITLVRETSHSADELVHNDRIVLTHGHAALAKDPSRHIEKIERALKERGFETNLQRHGDIRTLLTVSKGGKYYRISADSSRSGTTIQKGLVVADPSKISAVEAALLNRKFRKMLQQK
ncbi:MAG: hypothetical protein Q8R15_03625 [Candidatus Micrarchaeota archaeon]|nr:hypothetical protein [Candidatus Micrarchaeota archaeon]